jgi:HD-GYP domain-containing protein (c-di-GMP phosphodiesterase class II)
MKKKIDLKDICLEYPVYTISKKLLVPAGVRLDSEIIDSLRANNQKNDKYSTIRIMEYGSLLDDFFKIVEASENYRVIFSNAKLVEKMLGIITDIEVPSPVISYLEYFKLHDHYTYSHILLVFMLSTLLAMDLIEDKTQIIEASIAGPTHDFGKLAIPLSILTKNTPLTIKEKSQLEHHSVAGFLLLTHYFQKSRHLPGLVALQHHERRDGTGYPQGILLNNLMVEIVVACDIYDALVSPRPYRPTAFDNRSALEEITHMAKQNKLRWDVVKALISKNRKKQLHYKGCHISSEKRGSTPKKNLYGLIETKSIKDKK